MNKALSHLLTLLLVLVVSTGGATDAFAQARTRPGGPAVTHPVPERPATTGKVRLEMTVIYAHNEDNQVDPALRDVMRQLKNFRFTGYRMLENHPTSLAVGQSTSFAVPGGRKISMDLVDRNDTQAKVRIRMFNGSEKVLDTTVSIHRDRSFMIGGPSYEKGKLILPVTVNY